jgi:hypothetical protein
MVEVEAEQTAFDDQVWNLWLSNGETRRVIGAVRYDGSKDSLLEFFNPAIILERFRKGEILTDTELDIVLALS